MCTSSALWVGSLIPFHGQCALWFPMSRRPKTSKPFDESSRESARDEKMKLKVKQKAQKSSQWRDLLSAMVKLWPSELNLPSSRKLSSKAEIVCRKSFRSVVAFDSQFFSCDRDFSFRLDACHCARHTGATNWLFYRNIPQNRAWICKEMLERRTEFECLESARIWEISPIRLHFGAEF